MRSKNILSAAAFIVAFGFSAAFAGLFITKTETVSTYTVYNNSRATSCWTKRQAANADKISALIRQDHLNGDTSGKTTAELNVDVFSSDNASFAGYAKAVERYADLSGAMSVDDLPSDFQPEWREHMKAWRDYSEFLNRMKKPSNRAALSLEEFKEIEAFHSREIKRTWKEVLQNGRSYGADVY